VAPHWFLFSTDLEDHTPTENARTPLAKHDTSCVTKVHNTHVATFEVDHDPGSDVGEDAHTDGGDDTTDETKTEENGGEREDTESDVLWER
jgi:hypothetical protein